MSREMLKEMLLEIVVVLLAVVLVIAIPLVHVRGNSATATKLQTKRNIKVSGVVSGNADFDGSGNIEIKTTQANIAVLTGIIKNGSASISYPNGYNMSNCVIISAMCMRTAKQTSWSTGSVFDSSGALSGAIPFDVSLSSGGIGISVRNIMLDNDSVAASTPSYDFDFKLVLMKV